MGKGAETTQRFAINGSYLRVGLLLGALVPYAFISANQAATPRKVSFGREVAPMFKAHCISCHSGTSPAGQLDLSTAKGFRKGGVGGPLFVAGNPEKSLLVKRLIGVGGSQMPMGMPPLPTEDLITVKQWITSGAPFDSETAIKHWAYTAPVRPSVPALKSTWLKNPIDSFVLANLKKEGLRPSPEASKETLIRRVSFDLTGLPPTPAEVEAFVADKSPTAYDKVVDRLLASPHYGERQARGWLDLARYADTDGYEKDISRTAWEYRDWVINAYNRNMPYDQFTIEQIAGDLLPNATVAQKVATGFHRNTMQNLEGGVNQEEAHFAVVEDRAETTATVWLGSTLACARCHDHKYDPFTQRDYYKMVAFYNNTVVLPEGSKEIGEEKWLEPRLSIPTDAQSAEKQSLTAEVAKLDAQMKQAGPEAEAGYRKWLPTTIQPVQWTPIVPNSATSAAHATLKIDADGSVLAEGKAPDNDTYTVSLGKAAQSIQGLQLEALSDPVLPAKGPGRADNGNFLLNKIAVEADGKPVDVALAKADFNQESYDANDALLGNKAAGWAVSGQLGRSHQLLLTFSKPVPTGSDLKVTLDFQSRFVQHIIGKFRISATSADDPFVTLIPDNIKALLQVAQRTPAQDSELKAYYESTSREFGVKKKLLAATQRKLDDINGQIPTAMVLQEKPAAGLLTEWVRHRGEFTGKTEKVTAGAPAVLPPLAAPRPDRLTLARWLIDKKNPLTARVEVNRMWEQCYGRGIVETSEDFGTRGSPPTNRDLLDWLACEFMSKNWDMKAMLRLIVTSATYRQSSATTPGLLAKDPQNLLYARGPRFRMEAELIHDTALAASGLLSSKVGGPSVYPFQPDGIWDSPYSGERWMSSKGGERYRRGLYTFWKRTAPYPAFMAFDATSRESCTVRRIRTNTPLQALAQLNDQFVMQASIALGKRMEKAGKTDAARIDAGFQLCTARHAKPTELKRLQSLLAKLRDRYAHTPKQAMALDGTPSDAAWAMVGNVLLNLDETITKS